MSSAKPFELLLEKIQEKYPKDHQHIPLKVDDLVNMLEELIEERQRYDRLYAEEDY